VDPSERFFYVATNGGDVYHVPLFQRRAEMGARGDIEAVGGGGQGAPPIKVSGQVINLKYV
jgi:pre-rRNA-processing protein IPI3